MIHRVLGLALLCLLPACEHATAPAGEPAPRVPQRIVSLAPSVTELVFAVGAGSRLVGATSSCDVPEAARTVPCVGNYNAPNKELVIAADPDLVLVPQEGSLLDPTSEIEALGIRVVPLRIETLDDLYSACEQVGELTGDAERGQALADSLRERAAAVARAVAGRPRVRTLMVVDQQPTCAAGSGTFADALLRAAGATNAASNTKSAWPMLSLEAILALEPDAVIDLSMAGEPLEVRKKAQRVFWARLPGLAAVRHNRVLTLNPDLLVRPGPRLIDGLEALARALHPDAFATTEDNPEAGQ
ncbi:MAG: ABC transporter substrate-binding protein [Planctomycetota bacterium]